MTSTQAVFFDLDGTLVDTAPDLAYALNILLAEEGFASLPYESIRPAASNGTPALLQLGFNLTPADTQFEALQQRYIQLYRENITRHSVLFDGMDALITALEQREIPWGVITNKPAFLTDVLMTELGLTARSVCIVSGDTTPHSKPHPAPMLHACQLAGVAPEACLYLGDALRDIQAGKNANMRTLAAAYGYLDEGDDPAAWSADGIIHHPSELTQWL